MESGGWYNGAAKNLIIKERTFSVGRKLIFEIGQISFCTDTTLPLLCHFSKALDLPWTKRSNPLLSNRSREILFLNGISRSILSTVTVYVYI